MSKIKYISAAVISASVLMASQAALASQNEAGDIFVRGGFAKTDTGSGNGNVAGDSLNVQNESGFTFGAGYLFTPNVGLELNSSEKFEHRLNTGAAGDIGTIDRMPVNLMVNYYPLGGFDSRVQPYVGAGVNYTRFSGEPSDVNVKSSYGAIGQVGVDLAVTDNVSLNSFASYADVSSDIRTGGDTVGKVDMDPLTIGGGVTFRF
ncbi:outer membrane beta-barrel protein [Halomonas aquamarina]|uniref:Outer membrane beta-barrel protein n=1 Tax=Vreelandella aquamarina TaxID=77097 RepID=A0ACC5VWA4_9GAMM|nr:OmpW family outer membrane protein [Halomonas aquamarina]MBZ5488342.1 outer membrane beta-barrel protein [Halomonas aquamarina]